MLILSFYVHVYLGQWAGSRCSRYGLTNTVVPSGILYCPNCVFWQAHRPTMYAGGINLSVSQITASKYLWQNQTQLCKI
jgi:hypothetical protein